MDNQQIAARHYYDATSEQVRAAFAKYIRPDDLAMVVKGPEVVQ